MRRRLLIAICLSVPCVLLCGSSLAEEALIVRGKAPIRGAVQRLYPDDLPGVSSLGEVLERGGARIYRKGSLGREQTLTLRGSSARQVAVFLDEIPLSGALGGAFDLSELPIGLVDHLELIRGPASAMYGSAAQGGALVIHTRKPTTPRWASRVQAGSWGLLRGELSRSEAGSGWRWLGAGAFSRAEGDFGYADTNGVERIRKNNDHLQFNGLFNGTLDTSTGRYGVLLEGVDAERGEPGDSGSPTSRGRSVRQRVQAGLSWRAGRRSAYLSARRRRYELAGSEVTLVDAASQLSIDDQRITGAYLERVSWGPLALKGRLEGDFEAAQRSAPAPTGSRSDERLTGAGTLVTAFTSGNLELQWVNRLDLADTRDPVWVPHLGASWRHRRGAVFANVGRAFRNPSFDELYFRGPGIRGNPALRPEDGVGWELGARVGRRAQLGVVLFENRFDRLIFFETTGAYQVEARDDAAAIARGAEVDGQIDLGPVRLTGQYTYLDAFLRHPPQNKLPLRASHRAGGRAALRLGQGGIYGAGTWRSAVNADRLGYRTIPGRATVDVGVYGPVADDWIFGARVNNLLDDRGLDFVQRPLPGRSVLLELKFGSDG